MIKVLKVENENGQYIGKDGKRYELIYGTYAVGPRAKDFANFDSLQQAIEFYSLTEVEVE